MAQVFGIDRQPTQLDYASPTQFKFSIVQLPKVEFFTTACNLPSITANTNKYYRRVKVTNLM